MLVFMGVLILILALPMMHEQVHEGASEKKQVRKNPQKMRPVLLPIHGDGDA